MEDFAGRQLSQQDIEKLKWSEDTKMRLMAKFPTVPAVKQISKNRSLWQCQRCGNDQSFERLPNKAVYCLNCLKLGRLTSQEVLLRIPSPNQSPTAMKLLTWQGQLSQEQQRASNALCSALSNNQSIHIIQAVTGAGKTEMIFEVIEKVLQMGGRVAIASPRVDVCLELAPRIKVAFEKIPLITLHGTMTEDYHFTRIVIATTHQLWKFYQAFDLIIVDEIDAFPLSGDDGLHFAIQNAVKPTGKLVYLTATPDQYIEKLIRTKKADRTILPARYHRFPLPEPTFIWIGNWRQQIMNKNQHGELFQRIKQFTDLDGSKLIFMPDIQLAEALFAWLKEEKMATKMAVVHAKDPNRKEKVHSLREGTIHTLITTTILERGVTFTNCQVMIVGAEDRAYSSSAIIQMSGRVGRKKEFPSGVLWYAHYGINVAMLKARYNIKKMNQLARKLGLLDE